MRRDAVSTARTERKPDLKNVIIAALAATTLAALCPAASAQAIPEARHRIASRPLTVRPVVPVAPAYNPYLGAKAIVTAPLAVAGTIVSIPFRVADAVFPRDPRNPLSLIGAPIHYAGRVAQAPFRVVEAPFGGSAAPFGETPNYF